MTETLTILITGIGSPGAPGVIKSLRAVNEYDFYIVGIDINPYIAAKAMVDKYLVGPKASDANYIEKLLLICSEEKVDVVLPMVSQELLLFSKHIKEFRKIGTEVSVSNCQSLLKAMNKGNLFKFLDEKGVSVPEYSIVYTPNELQKAILKMGYPSNPVCMKPTISDGSRGFRILDKKKNLLNQLYFEKPSSLYIGFQELFNQLQGVSSIPETIVMEYLPFEEYSIDILARNGQVITAIPRLREEIVNGISVKGTIVKDNEIINYTSNIVKELGLHGNIGVQVRRDKNRQPKIIEINPRIQGTIVHCTAAGVNLPFLAFKLAKHLPISHDELKVRWGLRLARYWEEKYFYEDGRPVKEEE
ncbi:ATP-grasp domain-containing protein [Alkalihalobacillus macyae]|uniref:ATP-grasp domain-containing protein n=1 Tax=Guptibacillus hwajinpoensis TaxID=208199 RepID=UPI00273B7DEB|nr:ATP-grasp domain-containing protein [Alkalihalobacillus macyae]MDP4552067.1 ATP-grasp domain-containing protein [Alkalihalobacillus macyae]